MTKVKLFLEGSKANAYFNSIMLPQDALEYFEALSLAQAQIDPGQLCGPKVNQALLRLNTLKEFFALYYVDYLEGRLNQSELKFSS